ncbi:NAD(P)/FAD-dependent oxidoreductase [Williamsia sp. 1135]|uniref:NAD(P)/FAD-dependent oxidoreductase n=1 Tax=Williamsia sp. 1135 TaxID=1889262 RepID=UPI000A10FAFE|nr:NAD(P)/FAD-dependent oxidoreductase [Williamsia sp. 1135]ORM37404.1 thioredoxin reductase [Williamsia sp. 1135]
MTQQQQQATYDAIVIGGGSAGLSGAVMLGRSRRSVLVIDGGQPRNAPADGVHGFLTRDGLPPAELVAIGRDEAKSYGAQILDDEVVGVDGDVGTGFTVRTAGGVTVGARRLLVTTGLVDELPDIPGLADRWGKDLLHCPYCHGWVVRDQAIGILGVNAMSLHQAQMFRQLSKDIVLFHNDELRLTDDERTQLTARGIRLVEGKVAAVRTESDAITGVVLADGTFVGRQALTVTPRFVARAAFLADLGLQPVQHPMGVGEYIPADETGLTAVPGVWAAGNVSNLMAQVGAAAAAGAMAGAHINGDLIAAETRIAVAELSASAS